MRCIKVVLPEPAMPTQTIATGSEPVIVAVDEVEAEAAEDSDVAVEAIANYFGWCRCDIEFKLLNRCSTVATGEEVKRTKTW